MVRVIIAIVLSLLVAYFAIQNTQHVDVTLAGYPVTDTPMYIIVIGSVLFGLVIGLIFYLLHAVSSSFSMRGKDKELKEAQKTITDLTKRIHELELENAKLTGADGAEDDASL